MAENMQVDFLQRLKTGFVRCCHKNNYNYTYAKTVIVSYCELQITTFCRLIRYIRTPHFTCREIYVIM